MSDPEYRPIPGDRGDEFDRMVRYAFRPQEGPPDDQREDSDDEDGQRVGERRGLFDDGDLLAVCRQIYWPSTVRGAGVSLAGLSGVASPPESRRRGYVDRLMADSLEEYHDRGCEFTVLWPFERSFYARYGYATANAIARLSCPVEALSFAADRDPRVSATDPDRVPGEFRRVLEDDWAALDSVYRDHAAPYALSLDRDEDWWRERVFGAWGTDPYVYACERDGEVRGYVSYTIEDDHDENGDGRTFRMRDLAWTDYDAFLDLLRFAYYHDSQVDRVRLFGDPAGALRDVLDLIPSPGDEVDLTVRPGPMVRVVDVERALSTVNYPDCDERFVLSVSDPVVDRNDGRFLLDVADGAGSCRRVESDAGSRDPKVECSMGALSQAAVGYRSVDRLRRVADLDGDPGALDRFADAFPPDRVYLRDFF